MTTVRGSFIYDSVQYSAFCVYRSTGKERDAESGNDKLSSLREQRDQLKAKANKTPEDKAALDKVNKAINRETDRMRKSESHSQKQKGQQQ